jgi:hypothetical protein
VLEAMLWQGPRSRAGWPNRDSLKALSGLVSIPFEFRRPVRRESGRINAQSLSEASVTLRIWITIAAPNLIDGSQNSIVFSREEVERM